MICDCGIFLVILICFCMRGSRGGPGRPDSPEKSQIIGFLGITDSDPLKNHKDTKPVFKLGHHGQASEMPFKLRFPGGPIMTRL